MTVEPSCFSFSFGRPATFSTLFLLTIALASGVSHADPAFVVSSLNGSNGVEIVGAPGEQVGIAATGDIDGDGGVDMIVSAPQVNGNTGSIYVVFDDALLATGATLSLASLGAGQGFRLDGTAAGDLAGWSVASGDVNNDDADDLIIGAAFADSLFGKVYVVFGGQSFPAVVDLATLGTAGNPDGFVIDGIETGGQLGWAVASTDVNGNNVDDLVLGAPFASGGAGQIYVIFGAMGLGAPDLTTLNGTTGFVIGNAAADTVPGYSISSVQDINADGINDLLLGAALADVNGNNSGAAFVVFGSASPPALVDLSTLNGINGFEINGASAGDLLGVSVSGLGDVNDDNINDAIIGAPGAFSGAGAAYVIFGRPSFPGTLFLSTLDGGSGFMIRGNAGDALGALGTAVGNAGDFNNDGVSDLLVGAPRADLGSIANVGATFVVYGRTEDPSSTSNQSLFPATLDLDILTNKERSVIKGEIAQDRSGASVGGLGNFNGDDFDDVFIGTTQADANGVDSGAVYLVYGAAAELELDKSAPPGPIQFGDPLAYTLNVTNRGPSPAASLQITDILPQGTSFTSASGTNWSCQTAAGEVICDYAGPALAVNATAPTLTINLGTPGNLGAIIRNDARASSAWFEPGTSNTAFAETETEIVIFRDGFE